MQGGRDCWYPPHPRAATRAMTARIAQEFAQQFLTVGSFLLTMELSYLQLTILAFLLTVGAFSLTVLAFVLTIGAFLLTVGK